MEGFAQLPAVALGLPFGAQLRDPADRVVVSDDICCAYVKRRWDPDNVFRGNLNITPD
ncbi:MAG: BBE domain-containing protein [Candidatus Dormibacteraeota bacterium]|nr:BBE domain-containing protein [Candidatus Dormibacteraeota bacterium]